MIDGLRTKVMRSNIMRHCIWKKIMEGPHSCCLLAVVLPVMVFAQVFAAILYRSVVQHCCCADNRCDILVLCKAIALFDQYRTECTE